MNHPYIKPVFVTYLVVMSIIALFGNNKVDVYAEEMPIERKIVDKVKIYPMEMNLADFEEIKKDVLKKDVKYIAHPEAFEIDLALSEIVVKNINYASEETQEVEVEIIRYASSKNEKQAVDTISGTAMIQFADTTAPVIILTESDVELEEGSDFNAKDYVKSIEDNSFDSVNLDIDHDVDTDEPGEYEVVYTVTDKSGNTSSETLRVIVVELEEEEEEEVVAVAPAKRAAYTPPSVSASTGSTVYDTLSIINGYRASAGLAPLQIAGGAEQQAIAIRAAEASSFVSHTRPDGRSYETAFTDAGIHHSVVLEILTYSGSSPADKVAWWMSSGSHSAILMRSDITHIAIGIHNGMYAAIVYR